MTELRVVGGRMLQTDGVFEHTDLLLSDGRIAGIGKVGRGQTLDARGLLVLPGIVDLHGDAFERQLQPRPGVQFAAEVALRDTEAQLLANGITTAFHGITLSWEPGLRGAETWRSLLAALEAGLFACDMRVHLRWEAFNLDALSMALADIDEGRVHLLAFNDHTPAILRRIDDPITAAKYSDRAGMGLPEFRVLATRGGAAAGSGAAAPDRIAAGARAASLPVASHDDDSLGARNAHRARGARICEFPLSEDVAKAARAAGDWVVMGCPNVVRGGSHLGRASAARLAEEGVCTVLCSDYYYPAMPKAPLILARRGALDLGQAWRLISAHPAAAAGLTDRGRLESGLRGDLVLLDESSCRVVATITEGQIAYLGREGAGRLG